MHYRLCKILHTQFQTFSWWYPGPHSGRDDPAASTFSAAKRFRWLDPDTNFSLARQRSHCSCFTKRPLYLTHTRLLGSRRIFRVVARKFFFRGSKRRKGTPRGVQRQSLGRSPPPQKPIVEIYAQITSPCILLNQSVAPFQSDTCTVLAINIGYSSKTVSDNVTASCNTRGLGSRGQGGQVTTWNLELRQVIACGAYVWQVSK